MPLGPWFQGSVLQSCQFCSLKPPSLWSFAMAGMRAQTDRQTNTPYARSYKCRGETLQALEAAKEQLGLWPQHRGRIVSSFDPAPLLHPAPQCLPCGRPPTSLPVSRSVTLDIGSLSSVPQQKGRTPTCTKSAARAAQFCPLG